MDTGLTRQRAFFFTTALVTAALSIFCAVLMTEPGQSLALPRDWIVTYYHYRWLFIVLNVGLLALLWYLHARLRIWPRLVMGLASLGVALCILAANFLLPLFFPSAQYGANYVSVADADALLNDDSVIYAIENNGEVRGYPRNHKEIPHIAGDTIGGKEVALTFCALSNLPVAIEQGPIFPTLDLQDHRLNPKEQVWGFDNGTSQLAFTRQFARENPLYEFELDGQSLVLVYDKEVDVVNLFRRELDNQLPDLAHIDFRGVTGQGRLQQVPMHNGVFWMAWSHWYPNAQVLN